MIYHYFTRAPLSMPHIFDLTPGTSTGTRIQTIILGLWVECSTTLLLGHNHLHHIFCHFLSPGTSNKIWTFNVRIVSQMIYHYFTRAPLSMGLTGSELLTLGLWIECSTNGASNGNQTFNVWIVSHMFFNRATRGQCYMNFFPLSLTMRPNELEVLSLETLSSEVLEFEGKARANPIGAPFRCFLLWKAPGVTSKC